MASLCVFAPAKINLSLAITGRRDDGFHELISLVAPLDWGDTLWLETQPGNAGDTLACDHPDVPTDATNLVLKAAAAFRKYPATGAPAVHFTLKKEVPAGAGLGGGSSDAAAALRGLNQLAPYPLNPAELHACAAETGSDVPLFLEGTPVVMRGRGEINDPLPPAARDVLRGREILVFKPPFGVPTAWAYRTLREHGLDWYVPAAGAGDTLARWLAQPTWTTLPLGNNLEYPVFQKYAAIPVLLEELRQQFALRCRMSGSGSACFALLEADSPRLAIEQTIRDAWGPQAVVRATRLAGR
jgi:4-diphosphocytidyl-2-C-methyl-D-erythritol kinase